MGVPDSAHGAVCWTMASDVCMLRVVSFVLWPPQSVSDGGILLITCTDMAVLCGNHAEVL